jgi:hypothetical protein
MRQTASARPPTNTDSGPKLERVVARRFREFLVSRAVTSKIVRLTSEPNRANNLEWDEKHGFERLFTGLDTPARLFLTRALRRGHGIEALLLV